MKKTTLRQVALKLCLVALVLLSPFGLRAQETLTVYDGTNTNSNIPFYGLYADYGTRSQFIIPASSLEDMAGASIEKITFYTSAASPTYDEGVTVYLKEVENTVFASAALEDWSTMTPVYVGSVTVSSNAWEIVFSDSYTYEGGNLMIGVQVTTWGSLCPSINWYGVSQTTGTYTAAYNNANSSHTWNTTINRVAFLPKTTFTYELTQQGGDVCEKPATCETSDVTATSATLSWTGGSGTYNVEVKGGQWSDWTAILHSTPLTSTTLTLQPATSYQARVQSVCTGSNPTSTWKTCSSFSTPCASYDIPYTYGFEESTPFACWTPITGVSIVDHTSTQPTHDGTTGSKHLRFASTTSNLVALPQFNEPTNNLRVEFWTRPESATNASCGTFSVGYMTDITDASTFVEVANYAYNDWASTTYVKKAVDFVNVPSNANIAFRHNAGSSSWYWFVDDVTVKEMPSCVAPTALAANVSTTSAELSWTANSGETNWTLYYKKTTDENYTEVANATNPYTLNTLTAATNYQYYVVANCSSTDASEASEVFNFATECDAIVITTDGWTENFDSYTGVTSGTANNLPHCWNYINTSTYSSYKGYPVIYNASATSNSGNNHLRFYSYFSTYSSYDPQPQYAILPEMSNLDGMRIKLHARGNNATSTFKIGRMTDPTDASTFVPFIIGEGEEQALTTAYQEFTYNVTGTGNYLAIMIDAATSSRTSNSVYIDDIRVEPIPSCTEPSDLQFVSSTTTSATLQWTAGGNESAWDFYYSTENVAPLNSTEPLATATTNPATISNLTSATTYYVWVRAHCSNSDQSPWIGGISFNTACDAVTTFPWSENFESRAAGNFSAPCWVNEHLVSVSNRTDVFKVYTGTNGTNSTHQLQLPDMNAGNTVKLQLPEMTLPNDNYQFTIDFYRNDGSYASYITEGVSVFASTDGEIDGATLLAFIPRPHSASNTTGATTIPQETAAGWYTYELPIGFSGTCYIILRGESQYGTSSYMDNLVVEQVPTCRKPIAPMLETPSSRTAHTATLKWTNGTEGQNAWQIAYKANNNFNPNDAEEMATATIVSVTTNPATIEGLEQSTTYYAYVRANCGNDGFSAWSIANATFTTLAGNVTPTGLAVDASGITSSTAIASWDAVAGNTLHVSYELYWATSDVTSVPDDPEEPNYIRDIHATSQEITDLEPETDYKVWVRDNCGNDGRSAWSPAVTFTTAADCQIPDGIAATDVTNNSANINWNTYGQEGFSLRYSTDGDHWETVEGLSTSPYFIDRELEGNTTYQVQVQVDCNQEDWSSVFSFTTKCDAREDFPITYGFETTEGFPNNASTPTTNQLGNCWRNEATVQNGQYPTRVWGTSTTHHEGSQALVLPDKGNSTNFAKTMLVFPAMNFTSATGYTLSFWIYRNATSTNPEGFKVYASSTDTINNDAVELGHYSRNYNIAYPQIESASGWYQYEITIPRSTITGTVYIIFEGQSYYGNATYVDDITIDETPTCSKPTALAADNITSNSADLSWTANSAETEWTVYYKKSTETDYTEVSGITSNPYTLPGLDAATVYNYYVVANCSATDVSDASQAMTFATECEAIVITTNGWTENFDSYTGVTSGSANNLPLCWNYINTSTYSSYKGYPVIYNGSSYSNSGNNHLRFYSNYSSYGSYDPQPQYAILPEMSNLDGMRIKLHARGYYATSTFKIGRMTDPTDASTFVPFTIGEGEEQALTTAYQEFTYNITGSGDYLAIMIDAATSSRTTNGVYIDDIIIEPIPSCTEPSDLQFVSSTTTSATLQWTAGGNESAWDFYYSTENVAPLNSTEPLATATTNPATIEGLAASTTYYVWVRAHCSDADQSPWIGGISFNTACDAVTNFPWSENFESYNSSNSGVTFQAPCWVNEHISGTGSYFFEVYSGTNGTNTTQQLRLRDMSSGTMTKLMLPEMTLPSNNYQFTLDVYRVSASSYTGEGVRVFVSTDGEIEGATELAFISRNYSTTDGNLIPAESAAGWYTYELPINLSGTCYIILRGESKYGSHTYMDNFVVEQAPACRKPFALTVDNSATTAHTATLSWTNGAEGQNAWQIAYSTEADFDPATVTPVDVTTNPATIVNLTQSTTYYAYVRANCGNDGYSAWCNAPVTFTTITGTAVPTGLAFDNTTITANQVAVSWNAVAGNTLHQSYDLYYAESTVTAVPDEPAAPNFIAGITDLNYNITGLTAETSYNVWVRDNCGTDGYSAWSSPITFTTPSLCQLPDGLAETNVTTNSATISWNDYGQTGFNLRYGTDGETWTTVTGVTNPYTLDNVLTANTAYQVQVQAACNTAEWSTVLNFRTECEAITITETNTYAEDFEAPVVTSTYSSTTGLEQPFCWDNPYTTGSSQAGQPHLIAASAQYNYATNGQVLYFYGSGNNFVTLPEFSNAISELQISFKWATESSSNGALTLGYITNEDDGTYNTFTAIGESYAASSASYHQLNSETVYLNEVPAEATRLVFRWYYSGQWGANIDDIEVSLLPTCYPVGTLTSDNVASSSAELSWTLVDNTQTAWQVAYKASTDADFTIVTDVATVHENYVLQGLTPETEYTVKVRAYCGTDDQGEWSNTVSFTTLESCPVPTALAATDITNNSATISWTGDNDSYNVSYRKASTLNAIFSEGFENGMGDWVMVDCASNTGISSTASYVHSESSAFCFVYNTNPPQYLISPELTGVTEGMKLEFWYKNASTTYAETFHIGTAATTGTDAAEIEANFTFGDELTASDGQWHRYSMAIPAGTKYICWKLTSYDKLRLCIDDVKVGSTVTYAQTTLEGIAATSAPLTNLDATTEYEVQVQGVCNSVPTGWSAVYNFTTKALFEKEITANKWYAISSPVHYDGNNEAVSYVNNLVPVADEFAYDLYGYSEDNGTWVKETTSLTRGKGYIYRRDNTATLGFVGDYNTGSVSATSISINNPDLDLRGFALVGNPYNHPIYKGVAFGSTSYYITGWYRLQPNGCWNVQSDNDAIAAGEAALVKVSSSYSVSLSFTDNANAPSGAKSTPESPLAITVSNDNYEDVAYAMFSDGEGLPKIGHLTAEAPMLSIPVDGKKFAIAMVGDEAESFELNLSGESGAYTLSVANSDLSSYYYLHLVDRATGADVDLLSQPVYTFTQTGGNAVSGRFLIKLTPSMDAEGAQGDFAYWNGSAWVVEGTGDLQVFDVLGRKIYAGTLTTANTQLSNGIFRTTGVYILHLGEKSQKIVVK